MLGAPVWPPSSHLPQLRSLLRLPLLLLLSLLLDGLPRKKPLPLLLQDLHVCALAVHRDRRGDRASSRIEGICA